MINLDEIRRDYELGELDEASVDADPIRQFECWMNDAIATKIPDPTAMVLATVDAGGQPSQRIVLLKKVSNEGFVFFTNYGSKKAQDMEGQSHVSLLFPWHVLERQVIVKGVASKLSDQEASDYFTSRPKESQLAAWTSRQSQAISSRQALMQKFSDVKSKFKTGDVPTPDFWGGFVVEPMQIEFWQGGKSRLHDRLLFERVATNHSAQPEARWSITRLQP